MASPIPVIDLAAATGSGEPRALLDTVKEATETVGVVQVIHHGVPEPESTGWFLNGFRVNEGFSLVNACVGVPPRTC